MFLYEAKQILTTFLFLRPCSPVNSKIVFSGYNFSDNSVQALSSIHSNVQLLYLLLFFAVDVAVTVLIVKNHNITLFPSLVIITTFV